MLTLSQTTFVCPSYWMVEAYSQDVGKAAYKYQYSVPLGTHGTDLTAYFGQVPPTNQPLEFQRAFMTLLGNFIVSDDPSISAAIANGPSSTETTNPASDWPAFSVAAPYQIDLNTTGGTPYQTEPLGAPFNVTQYINGTNDIVSLGDLSCCDGVLLTFRARLLSMRILGKAAVVTGATSGGVLLRLCRSDSFRGSLERNV